MHLNQANVSFFSAKVHRLHTIMPRVLKPFYWRTPIHDAVTFCEYFAKATDNRYNLGYEYGTTVERIVQELLSESDEARGFFALVGNITQLTHWREVPEDLQSTAHRILRE
jgi:hypothetical protein